MRRILSALVVSISLSANSAIAVDPATSPAAAKSVDEIAEAYVHLVLAMGQHDADYVDAFYGPAEWKTQAAAEKKPLDAIRDEARELSEQLTKRPLPAVELEQLRVAYLTKQLSALEARVRIVKGERLKFDDEARVLYDATPPTHPDSEFDQTLAPLEAKIPGKGPLAQRYEEWRKRFVVPKEKLDAVFQLAIKECRARTLAHVQLPPEESFTVEYVTGKSWGGYNWYQGNYHSLIQVNTDLPVYIDRAVDLAAHEGYPGHHVYNALLEKNLVRDRGWMEFSVYALFSPQSLIAEGTANYGKEVVFTKAERMKFEKEVLFPAAGIDPKLADDYYAVQEIVAKLSYAGNEAARKLLDGAIDADAAAALLEKYALMDPARAKQRLKFVGQYRSYVINYNVGEDLVRNYVEKRIPTGGSAGDIAETRWRIFEGLLSAPHLPSELQ